MNRIIICFLFLSLFACSDKSFKGFDKTYFEFNNSKIYASRINLETILETFGTNYNPIKPKSVSQVDANLKPIVKNLIFKLSYDDLGITFLIHSPQQITIDDGKIKKSDELDLSQILVKEVRISSAKIPTNIGVKIGDSESSVLDKFGSSEMPWRPLGYSSLGLSFDVDEQKNVNEITIYKPFNTTLNK